MVPPPIDGSGSGDPTLLQEEGPSSDHPSDGDPRHGSEPENESPEPDSPAQMAVSIKGTPDAIKKAARKTLAPPTVPPGSISVGGDHEPDDLPTFSEALRQPSCEIAVHRVFPQALDGADITGQIASYPTPLAYEDLKRMIEDTHGGEKFVLRVVDVNGDVLAARPLTINAPAKIVELGPGPIIDNVRDWKNKIDEDLDPDEAEIARVNREIQKENAYQRLARVKQAAAARGQAEGEEIKRLEVELEALKRKDQFDQLVKPLHDKIRQLEGQLNEAPAEDPEDLRQTLTLQNELNSLKMQLQQLVSTMSQPRQQDSGIKDLIQLMMSQNQQTTNMLIAMINRDRDKGEGRASRDPVDTVGGVVEVMTGLMGLVNPNMAPQEPKGALERIVDYIPDVLELLREKQNQGANITRQEVQRSVAQIMPSVSQHIRDTVTKVIAQRYGVPPQQQQQVIAQRPIPSVPTYGMAGQQPVAPPPPPAQSPPPAAPPPSRPATPPPVSLDQMEGHGHGDGVAEEEAEPESDAEEEGLNPEDEAYDRVNEVLERVRNELKLKVRGMTWPQLAWQTLPGNVLEGIVYSTRDEDVYDAIKGHGDPDLMREIWDLIKSDSEHKERLVIGINAIKDWARAEREQAAGVPLQQQPPPQPPPPHQ